MRLAPAAMVLAVSISAAPRPAHAGTITGTVEVLEKGGRKATDLGDVVVYVDGPRTKSQPSKAAVSMKAKVFNPHVVAVGVGSTVDFPNEDPILHNVFSVSGDNRFDLQLYKRPKVGSWTFQHPGVVRVYCNIHPQMSAVVFVHGNPHFAKANADGTFVIEGVPAGKHVVKAFHERGGEGGVEVTVPADGQVTAALKLDASNYKRLQHKNKFGKDYTGEKY